MERGNFTAMSKASIHIGKKIKEVLDKTSLSTVDFAKKINLTRNGAYKVFEKETIDTGQLQTISKVLNHDFFAYYENQAANIKEIKPDYGYATKAEVSDLAHAILKLTKAVEKIQEQLPQKAAKKATAKKDYTKVKK
ncbi:MAG: hypothetical protein K0S53_1317 [Bacteroidetes bacterium]|nr:hypothetical protein [Bacteroidota bacterium]MDF2452387.1 hypothetical protein [Bacteroidota bacterium]